MDSRFERIGKIILGDNWTNKLGINGKAFSQSNSFLGVLVYYSSRVGASNAICRISVAIGTKTRVCLFNRRPHK